MKRTLFIALFAVLSAAVPSQAQLNINLDNLAAKAKGSVDVSLDAGMLRLAGNFLSSKKGDEAAAKELVSKLTGVYVRTFEFDKEGLYSQADLLPVRNQLKAPGWSKMLGVQENSDREGVEIYVKTEGGQTAGIAVLAYEPKELTIVSILGQIDLERLGELGGRFGIPVLPLGSPKKTKTAK
jgi:hypothetical protein